MNRAFLHGKTTMPSSNQEWTIHSINIHGLFFERWCEHVASTSGAWCTKSVRLPVEFPPSNGPLRGMEGELDLWLEAEDGAKRINLLIECKKNNPEFVDWIFFQRQRASMQNPYTVSQVTNVPKVAPSTGWEVSAAIRRVSWSGLVSDDGRETRGDYLSLKNERQKTKTANAAIADAAHQVALSTRAVVAEQMRLSNTRGAHATATMPSWESALYFPIIATTANLYLCSFNAEDVSPERGELEFSKARLEPASQILYEYALPRHLQFAPADPDAVDDTALETFHRMHIMVVQSRHLETFLASGFGRFGGSSPAPGMES
jgi:hypothetical protein